MSLKYHYSPWSVLVATKANGFKAHHNGYEEASEMADRSCFEVISLANRLVSSSTCQNRGLSAELSGGATYDWSWERLLTAVWNAAGLSSLSGTPTAVDI